MFRPTLLIAAVALCLLPSMAEARLRWPVPQVPVVYAPCPGIGTSIDGITVGGCYTNGTIYVSVPAGADPVFALNHERGHVIDERFLDNAERQQFDMLLNRYTNVSPTFTSSGPWLRRADGQAPVARPGELFADAYANCAMHYRPINGTFAFAYGYDPKSNAAHARICDFIRQAGSSRASSSSSHPTPGTAGRQQRQTQRSQSRPAQQKRRALSRSYRRAVLRSEVRALRYAMRAAR